MQPVSPPLPSSYAAPRPSPLPPWRHHLREAARLVLPVSCAGCGRWDVALCPDCRSLLTGEPIAVEHADAAGDLDVSALAVYAGPVRPMVLGWKNGAREDLAAFITDVGARAGRRWARRLDEEVREAVDAGPLLVVPAPSGWVRRARGRLVTASLADAVARGAAVGWPRTRGAAGGAGAEGAERTRGRRDRELEVLSVDLLRRPGLAGAHQTGRSARQRRTNRARAPRVLAPIAGLSVLLVDDVVTTGATLGACARALRQEGASVIGALAVAAAPPPARRTRTVVPGGPVSAPGDQPASVPAEKHHMV